MTTVTLVGEDTRFANELRQVVGGEDIEVLITSWAEWLESTVAGPLPAEHVNLLDLTTPGAPRLETVAQVLLEVRARQHEVRTILAVEKAIPSDLTTLRSVLQSPLVDFVQKTEELDEVYLRIARLSSMSVRRAARSLIRTPPGQRLRRVRHRPTGPANTSRTASVLSPLVPELHAPDSGRLDARRVSELFGIPLTDTARLLGRGLSTVHKTPDAPALQSGLAMYEKIAAALLRLAGSSAGLRIWMNAPNPELEDETPLELLRKGEGEMIVELLEDALLGQPG